jgi:thymidylate synthase ThyX
MLSFVKEKDMEHKNTVELIGTYGSDLTHSLSAWTSTSRELTEEKRGRMGKLLMQLGKDGHHSVFEKSSQHFLMTTDICTHYQLLKHRVGVSCVTGDTEIHIQIPGTAGSFNNGVKLRTIAQIYDEHINGIEVLGSTGKLYRRKYGRPIPVRTKANDSNLIKKSYIKDVFYNGKKEVFEFITDTGKKIKTTRDHRFLSTEREWCEIGSLLGLEIINGIATISNNDCYVATNGIKIDDPDRPWTFRSYFEPYENKNTTMEVAHLTGLKYELVKKWGYIHNIKFLKDEDNGFKKWHVTWNKGKYGYHVKGREKRGISPNINPDLTHKSWRATVGNWTREQLPKLLVKYSHTCQAQLGVCSRDFVCHHVVPVSIDATKATDIDNLLLVCGDCHKLIHKSRLDEEKFATQIVGQEIKTVFANRKPKKGRKLSIDFEKIVKVRYVGIEDVYDLEVEGTHNYVANGFVIHNCNAESARYKELKDDKFYVPTDWVSSEQRLLIDHCERSLKAYHECLARLIASGMPKKRAKESARFYLPYSNQITSDVMFNFRSFMHFQGLRNSEHAQKEIRDIAKKMLILVYETGQFNMSLEAFGWTKEKIYTT